jgi:hypothetical protein
MWFDCDWEETGSTRPDFATRLAKLCLPSKPAGAFLGPPGSYHFQLGSSSRLAKWFQGHFCSATTTGLATMAPPRLNTWQHLYERINITAQYSTVQMYFLTLEFSPYVLVLKCGRRHVFASHPGLASARVGSASCRRVESHSLLCKSRYASIIRRALAAYGVIQKTICASMCPWTVMERSELRSIRTE